MVKTFYSKDEGRIFLYNIEVIVDREEDSESLSLCLALTLDSAVGDTEGTRLISAPARSSISFRSSSPVL
jgi:hypothetical protein